MINDLILLQQLMEKYKLPEPVPAAVRDFVLRSRRKTLLNIMRKLDIYSPIFGVIIFVFFFLKKLGFNVTIVKTTIIIGLSSLLLSASISYGIYNIVENNNSGVSKQIKEHDSKIDNKIHDAAGNPDDALLKQIRDLVDAALIWNGDFIIRNIRDIDKIKEYSIVKGKLIIKSDSLNDLEGLSGLISVGSLYILDNVYIKDLRGLENIELLKEEYFSEADAKVEAARKNERNYVPLTKNTTLPKNTKLFNMRELYKIDPPGTIHIIGNSRLTSLEGLENLARIAGNVIIGSNQMLNDLNGLNNVESIGGELEIKDNGELAKLKGLESLKYVKENLKILRNKKLKDLNYLKNIYSIGNSLHIRNNISLITLRGLSNLAHIKEDILIENNPNLLSIAALQGVRILDTLNISNNLRLHSLAGLNNLIELKQGLYVKYNRSLKTISSLSGIETIRGNITITNNKQLDQMDAIEFKDNVKDFEGRVSIRRNFEVK